MIKKLTILLPLVAVACQTEQTSIEPLAPAIEQRLEVIAERARNETKVQNPYVFGEVFEIVENDPQYDFLREITVDLQFTAAGRPMSELIPYLVDKGINISTGLNLDDVYYRGSGFSGLDGYQALVNISTNIGMDFMVENENVLLVPMRAKSWTLSLTDGRQSFSTGGNGNGNRNANNFGTQGQGVSTLDTEGAQIETSFETVNPLTTLGEEIEQWLQTVLPMRAQENGAGPVDYNFRNVTIGQVTVNPNTGLVRVQAPRWFYPELDAYMEQIQKKYNTYITLYGSMVLVTRNNAKTAGIDLNAFNQIGDYDLILSNPANGGVSVFRPTAQNDFQSGFNAPGAVSSTGIGISQRPDANRGLDAFTAFLSRYGTVSVSNAITISGSSGKAVEGKSVTSRVIQVPSQNAGSGGAGSFGVTQNIGVQNERLNVEIGYFFTALSNYDVENDLVRSDILFTLNLQSDTDVQQSFLATANGIQQSDIEFPVLQTIEYRGDVLVRPGDIIVLGGQASDNEFFNTSGVRGRERLGAGRYLLGSESNDATSSTYYIALEVGVEHKNW